MNRFSNLTNYPLEPLGDVENPPAERLDKDYVQASSNPRRCKNCNKLHDCILENVYTGERLEELDKCYDCLMNSWFKPILREDNGESK